MTDTTTTPATRPEVPEVSTNPALLEFPTDKWGYTSNMRKELLRAASTIKGQPDKAALYLATLDLIRAHVVARFKVDRNRENEYAKDAAFYASKRNEYKGRGRP